MRRPAQALDVVAVAAFVAIGRASHHHGETAAGIASTAWPFLAGVAAGWVAARCWRLELGRPRAGAVVTAATVAVGMALRVVAGQGSAVAFVAVAVVFLGALQVGGRLALRPALAAVAVRRRRRSTT